VAHHSRLCGIVIDAPSASHDRELAFWQAATGRPLIRIEEHPGYHGAGAEVARLEALGGQRAAEAYFWQVMRDRAGLPFCVMPDPPGTLTAENAKRWE
jgi:hypothetical protein